MKEVYNYAMTFIAVARLLGRRAKRKLDLRRKVEYIKEKIVKSAVNK